MNLIRIYFIVLSFVLLPIATSNAQSVKDVTEDKSGRYIYSQARNADEKMAYESALDELKSKVKTHLESNGQSGSDSGWTSSVQKIVTEKFGVYRVFLYVTTENIAAGNKTASSPAIQTKSTVTEAKSTGEKQAASVNTDKTINTDKTKKTESQAKVTSPATQPERKQTGTTITPKAEEEETQPGELPTGMIGDIIRMILEDGQPASVGNILEKGKNMRAVSMYGSADTKYASHAYFVTLEKGKLHVYSPKNQEGMRTDYSDGRTSDDLKGKMIYWFLKK